MISEQEFDEAILLITLLLKQSFAEAMEEQGIHEKDRDAVMESVGRKLADAVAKEEAAQQD